MAAGEGEKQPTPSCNATLEISLYTLGGLKLLDNKLMKADFFEIPIVRRSLITGLDSYALHILGFRV